MYWFTTVAFAAFSIARIDAGAVAIVDFCKAAGSEKLTVCSALGFNGVDGNSVFDSVFKGLDDVVIVRDDLDLEGSSDITVAMVKTVELNGDLSGLQVTIQNILEEAMYTGRRAKLIVIITGES
jgi:hypothetical protein